LSFDVCIGFKKDKFVLKSIFSLLVFLEHFFCALEGEKDQCLRVYYMGHTVTWGLGVFKCQAALEIKMPGVFHTPSLGWCSTCNTPLP
jgi:hypothetical protein